MSVPLGSLARETRRFRVFPPRATGATGATGPFLSTRSAVIDKRLDRGAIRHLLPRHGHNGCPLLVSRREHLSQRRQVLVRTSPPEGTPFADRVDDAGRNP